MTIISYAQNFEDVILWRALKHIERGFYIDVGAQDPVIDSVSLAFYERGWRGVHIEPTPRYAEEIRKARPDEVVIEAAVASLGGEITFFELPETGLSTGEESVAKLHQAKGYSVQKITVPALPLSKVLESYRTRDIHWLKIDVEGMEEQVIEGWTASSVRPWVVLVESTKPTSPEVSYSAWEPRLIALGYEFVYFDGLNRFYVSEAHPELKAAFGPGPNVFDDFMLGGSASAPFCRLINSEKQVLQDNVLELASAAEVAKSEAKLTRAELAAAQATLETLQAELALARSEAGSLETLFSNARTAWEKVEKDLVKEIAMKDDALSSRGAEIGRLNNQVAALTHVRRELDAVYRSTSWRVTAPLRLMRRIISWTMRAIPRQLMTSGRSLGHLASVKARPPHGTQQATPSPPNIIMKQLTHPPAPLPDLFIPAGSSFGSEPIIDQLDTRSEPESVQRTYKDLVRARKQILRSGQGLRV